jgi:non-specific serine/threonine protein kinase
LLHIASVQLFVQRAQDVQSTFALTARNAATVAAICGRLDGLPLAIELAAGWVRSLSADEILIRLDNAFQVLVGGSRTAPTRQHTMWATLDWSHALLAPPEQALFRRLAVFAGDWDLPAIQEVCAGGEVPREDVLWLLRRLVDTSLVQMEDRTGGARYRLLEPVRDFARHHLEVSGEAHATRRAHAEYFRRWAQRVALEPEHHIADRAKLTLCLDRMEHEHNNIRLALQWLRDNGVVDSAVQLANAAAELWQTRGYLSEGRRWMADLLDRPGADAERRAMAFGWAGNFAWFQGDPIAARALHAESLALARQCGNDIQAAYTIGALGRDALALGDYAEAERLGQEALARARALGEPAEVQWTLCSLGTAAYEQMDWARAEMFFTESLASARASPACRPAEAVYGLGCVAHQSGQRARAHELIGDALAKLSEIGDRASMAQALVSVGHLHLDSHDPVRARAAFAASLEVTQDLEDRVGFARCFEAFAALAAATGQGECAWRLVGAADQVRAACHMPRAPVDRAQLARRLDPTRLRLGDDQVAVLLADGRALGLDEAIALALRSSGSDNSEGRAAQEPEELTAREREVMALVARGLTNQQIAEELVITRRTVAAHVEHILRKLGFSSRHQVASWAAERGV